MKIIVPVTDWKDRYAIAPWMVKITQDKQNKLTKESSADCFQIRSISEQRCVKKLGEINLETMDKIRKALAVVLDIA